MIPSLIHAMMTALIRVWMAFSRHSWRRLSRPQDAPHVHAPGVTPDRMLMIGSGAAVGYGVLHWELSLTGQLAKRVAELNGRGLDIDISVDPSLNVVAAVDTVKTARIERYDAIVFLIGSLEALELYPERLWEQHLRALFDAAGAAFNLIDDDRVWPKGAAGLSTGAMEVPRRLSFCSTTIEQSRLLVIPDMTLDLGYRAHPQVVGPPSIRFYAGYPVESPDGHRVGSLCVIDTKPRAFSAVEATLLREMALRAQTMLWERRRS